MARILKALAASPEDLDLVPYHIGLLNHPHLQLQGIQRPLQELHICGTQTYMEAKRHLSQGYSCSE